MPIFKRAGFYMGELECDPAEVGERLERIRMALGIASQAEFGEMLGGVSRGRMNNWIKGVALIPVEYAVKLKRLKGVPLDFLYCGDTSSLPLRLSALALGELPTSKGDGSEE